MKVTYEERPLEELENEIVEYIINTPNNANPNVVRTMISSAGEKVGTSGSEPTYFVTESTGSNKIGKITNLKTGKEVTLKEIIEAGLSGNGFFVRVNKEGESDWTNRKAYFPELINGFVISSSGLLQITTGGTGRYKFNSENIGDQYLNILENYFANL